MNVKVVAVIATLVMLGGAGPHGQGQTSRAAEEVTALLWTHRSDYLKGDANAWAALYAEDAVFVRGQGNLEGRLAIQQYFAQVIADFPSRTADASNLRCGSTTRRRLRLSSSPLMITGRGPTRRGGNER